MILRPARFLREWTRKPDRLRGARHAGLPDGRATRPSKTSKAGHESGPWADCGAGSGLRENERRATASRDRFAVNLYPAIRPPPNDRTQLHARSRNKPMAIIITTTTSSNDKSPTTVAQEVEKGDEGRARYSEFILPRESSRLLGTGGGARVPAKKGRNPSADRNTNRLRAVHFFIKL